MNGVLRTVFHTLVEGYNGIQLSEGRPLQSDTRKSNDLPCLVWRLGTWQQDDWESGKVRYQWTMPVEVHYQNEAGNSELFLDALSDIQEWTDSIYGLNVDEKGNLVPLGERYLDLEREDKLFVIADRFRGPWIKQVVVRAGEADSSYSVADLQVYVEFVVDYTVMPDKQALLFSIGANVQDPSRVNPPLNPADYKLPVIDQVNWSAQGSFATPMATDAYGNPVSASFPPVVADKPRVDGTNPGSALARIYIQQQNPYVGLTFTQQLIAIAQFADSSTLDITSAAQWSSLSPSVATVGAGGLLTGVSFGRSNITAQYEGQSYTVSALSGGDTVRRTITQPGDGSDFTVTLSVAMPNDSYDVVGTQSGGTPGVIVTCPDVLANDRTTTTFRCITSASLATGSTIDFVIVPR